MRSCIDGSAVDASEGQGRAGEGGTVGICFGSGLGLLARFGADALDVAIAEAHGRSALSAQSVAHILDQARRAQGAPPPLQVILPDDPRVRDLRVTPHSLANYDVLIKRESREGSAHE